MGDTTAVGSNSGTNEYVDPYAEDGAPADPAAQTDTAETPATTDPTQSESEYDAAKQEATDNTTGKKPTSTSSTSTTDASNDAPAYTEDPDFNPYGDLLSGETFDDGLAELPEDISAYDYYKAITTTYPEFEPLAQQILQETPEEPIVKQDAQAVIADAQDSEEAAEKQSEQSQKQQEKKDPVKRFFQRIATTLKTGDNRTASATAGRMAKEATTTKEKKLFEWIKKTADRNVAAEKARSTKDSVQLKQEKNAGDKLNQLLHKKNTPRCAMIQSGKAKDETLTPEERAEIEMNAEETGANEGIEGDTTHSDKARRQNAKNRMLARTETKTVKEAKKAQALLDAKKGKEATVAKEESDHPGLKDPSQAQKMAVLSKAKEMTELGKWSKEQFEKIRLSLFDQGARELAGVEENQDTDSDSLGSLFAAPSETKEQNNPSESRFSWSYDARVACGAKMLLEGKKGALRIFKRQRELDLESVSADTVSVVASNAASLTPEATQLAWHRQQGVAATDDQGFDVDPRLDPNAAPGSETAARYQGVDDLSNRKV